MDRAVTVISLIRAARPDALLLEDRDIWLKARLEKQGDAKALMADESYANGGDKACGESLSVGHTSSHRAGNDAGAISVTNGYSTAIFLTMMGAFKAGARRHPATEMMAGRLSNEEAAALAVYFEGIE